MVLVAGVIACVLSTWLPSTSAFADDLSIDRLVVRVKTVERLARTRMTLVIRNNGDEWQEAFVDLDLPRNAVVTSLSMDVGTQENRPRMQGRIFDRNRAAQVYQDIVDSVQDPAILEDEGEGRYHLRVFPVPEHDKKTVIIEYEHLLPQRDNLATYLFEPPELSLDGAMTIPRFTLSIDGRIEQRGPWFSGQPLRVPLFRKKLNESKVQYTHYKGKTYFRVDIVPEVEVEQQRVESVVLAIDSSRTSQHSYDEALEQSRIVVRELAPHADVRIVRGDQEIESCTSLMCVSSIRPGGASNLYALLQAAIDAAASLPGPVAIVLVGDGHRPADAYEDTLVNILEKLPKSNTFHALAVGRYQNRFLRRLTRAGRGHLTFNANSLLQQIFEPVVGEISIRGDSEEVLINPKIYSSARVGEPITVYGRLKKSSALLQVHARIGQKEYHHEVLVRSPGATRNRSVLRGWVRTAIAALAHELSKIKVLTPSKAFLVLETVGEYEKLKEPPRMLMHLSAPRVKIGNASPMGDLDKGMLRRRVRLVQKKIRHCYNRILRHARDAEGTMIAQWTIEPDGKSVGVRVKGDIDSEELRECIARVHQGIRFPTARGGGYIHVRYPYNFIPPAKYNTKLSVADEGQKLVQLLDRGDVDGATALLARIKSKLALQPDRALLPYLSSIKARIRFAPSFRRAALDSIDDGSATLEVWLQLSHSFARDSPTQLVVVLGKRKPPARIASAILRSLIESGRRLSALELIRVWRKSTMTSDDLYEVFTRESAVQAAFRKVWMSLLIDVVDQGKAGKAVDYLIETAHSLDQDSDAVDRILKLCKRQSTACDRWLSTSLRDSRMLKRLHTLYDGQVARLTIFRQSSDDVEKLGRLLELLHQPKEAARVRSELDEY